MKNTVNMYMHGSGAAPLIIFVEKARYKIQYTIIIIIVILSLETIKQ
jgi:hypothetical protein